MSDAHNLDDKLRIHVGDMHADCREWLSMIAFARDELNFFQQLLDTNVLHVSDDHQFKQLEHLQNRLIYYRDEVVDQYEHDVKELANQLAKIEQGEYENEDTCRRQYAELKEGMQSFSVQLRTFKRELFAFVEEVTQSK